mmetsp:Transcript_102453/g.260172  ORF Transcript_102453/g.260172 Transcript_102453/m.260172 type:complete len:206 (-) Transcript_102453:839-1456(-)
MSRTQSAASITRKALKNLPNIRQARMLFSHASISKCSKCRKSITTIGPRRLAKVSRRPRQESARARQAGRRDRKTNSPAPKPHLQSLPSRSREGHVGSQLRKVLFEPTKQLGPTGASALVARGRWQTKVGGARLLGEGSTEGVQLEGRAVHIRGVSSRDCRRSHIAARHEAAHGVALVQFHRRRAQGRRVLQAAGPQHAISSLCA